MENPAVDQLPEAHSLPDGFVDSSVEPLTPSTPMLGQEMPLTDSKEEKLVEPNSSPDLVVGELQSSEEKTEKSENSRTFPVTLTENDGSDTLPELGEVDGCSEDVVRESGEQLAGSSCGKLRDQEKCQSSEKAIEGGLDTQAAHMNEICKTGSAENNRKLVNNIETSEVKRKNTKQTFKSEKEFLEFTLKYQQVLAERDAAIADRDKHDSQCQESQRQNKMLMLKQKMLEQQIADLKTQLHEEKLLQQQKEKLRLLSTVDGENFQPFQDALVKSNVVLIGQMGKSKKKLMKENTVLQSKSDRSDIDLIKLDKECEHLKTQLERTKKVLEKTRKSLCRFRQAERKQNSTGGASNTDSVAV